MKMDSEDQILRGTKLIANIKKQRLKTQNRGWTLKYTVQKIQSIINHKNYIYIYIWNLFFKIVIAER